MDKRLFGEIAVNDFGVKKESIEQALQSQEMINLRIGEILLSMGAITEDQITKVLSKQFGLRMFSELFFDQTYDFFVFDSFSPYWFIMNESFLIKSGDKKYLVLKDPLNSYPQDIIRLELSGEEVESILVEDNEWRRLETLFSSKFTKGSNINFNDDEIEKLKDMASEAPIIRLVNNIFSNAVKSKASDIHIEVMEKEMLVRYRIDGVLHTVETLSKSLSPAVISRIKILSKLDIAEKRLPQDGRIELTSMGRAIDVRVSIIPTVHGENVVMRLLEKEDIEYSLQSIGLLEEDREIIESMVKMPYGIFLVTGPTGSGKTTTLYSILKILNEPSRKIITVEDPVEYQIQGINQIQVQSNIGLTFSSILRNILRQDPDIIMIGEIRDKETAEIAIQASLTGHLVLATLHTNDAPSAITRLLDMGIEDYLINTTIIGVVAQRLVRKICQNCGESYTPTNFVLEEVNFKEVKKKFGIKKSEFKRARGCNLCANTGYKGRIGIFEIMKYTDDLKLTLIKEKNYISLRDRAIKGGMRTLREDGLVKWAMGITTIEEIFRVT